VFELVTSPEKKIIFYLESASEGKQRHKSIKIAVILNLTHETKCVEISPPAGSKKYIKNGRGSLFLSHVAGCENSNNSKGNIRSKSFSDF